MHSVLNVIGSKIILSLRVHKTISFSNTVSMQYMYTQFSFERIISIFQEGKVCQLCGFLKFSGVFLKIAGKLSEMRLVLGIQLIVLKYNFPFEKYLEMVYCQCIVSKMFLYFCKQPFHRKLTLIEICYFLFQTIQNMQ